MTWLSPAAAKTQVVLPFTRDTPDRIWLGFVNEADDQPASMLNTRILPLLAVVGVGLLVMSGGKQEHEDAGPPPSSAAAARMKLAAAGVPQQDPDEDATPDSLVDAQPTPTQPAEVAPTDGQPATEEPAEAQPAEAPPAEAPPAEAPPAEAPPAEAPPAASDPEPVAKPKREPKPPKPLSPAAARKATRAAAGLRAALKDGRVKASRENFAVVSDGGSETGWDDAKAACSGLDIDGIGGWRLPSRGEAREIQRGKAAPRAAYWTRQRGPHDDTIYVHDPRTRRSSPWLDQEIASVVCVQPKPR